MLAQMYILTVSFTIAMLLAGVIATFAIFWLASQPKFMKWFLNYYMKSIEKQSKVFFDDDVIDQKVDA